MKMRMKYYVVKTKIGSEAKVIKDIKARLSGTGSMKDITDKIGKLIHIEHMSGFIYAQAEEQHYLEKVLGLLKERHITRIKNVSYVVGEETNENVEEHIKPRDPLEGIVQGVIVHLLKGAFKGNQARVLSTNHKKQTVSVELHEGAIPIPINDILAKDVRIM